MHKHQNTHSDGEKEVFYQGGSTEHRVNSKHKAPYTRKRKYPKVENEKRKTYQRLENEAPKT